MKISTNFVYPLQLAVMPVVIAMWLAAAGFAAGAGWLLDEAATLRSDLPQLKQRLERAEKTDTVTSQEHMPTAQELSQTRNRIAKINAAARTAGVQSAVLLNRLETLLPPEAWLASLHYRATEGEVRMVVSAKNIQTLTSFLQKLEHDPLFEEVMLMHEMQAAANAQYEIRMKVRS